MVHGGEGVGELKGAWRKGVGELNGAWRGDE